MVSVQGPEPRVEQALAYIEAHLAEPISWKDVARAASLSTFHFHRVFRARVGLPLGEYIRRRRLEAAAQEILETEHRIIDIAVKANFGSQEAFTRAFKAQFGVTPGLYRAEQLKHRLTPLQTKKMTRFFQVWDYDRNGLIERRDFDALVIRLARECCIAEGTPQYTELKARYDAMWDSLKSSITEPDREGLLLPEWLAACGALLPTAAFKAQVGGVVDFVWFLLDSQKTGSVSRDGYARVVVAYQMPPSLVDELFARLGKKPGDTLDRVEIAKMVEEFYWSEDPEAPGGFLWGPFD